VDAIPKTPKEWLVAAIWGIFAVAAGGQFINSAVHGELWPAIYSLAIFLVLCVIIVAVIFSEQVRQWIGRLSPNWFAGAIATSLIIVALSPYVQEKHWPFSDWLPTKPPSADEIANAVIGKLPKQATAPVQAAGATAVVAQYVNPLHDNDTKWKVTQDLRLWSLRSTPYPHSPDCLISIVRYPETYSEDFAADFKVVLDVVGRKYTEHLADGTLPKGITVRAVKNGPATVNNGPSEECASVLSTRIQSDAHGRRGGDYGIVLQWLTQSEASDFLKQCPHDVGCVEVTFGNEDTTR
jgi:hypothetical protein